MWVENHRHPVEQIFIHVSVIVGRDPLILSNLPGTLTCTCPICHQVDKVTHYWAVSMSLLIKPTFSPPQSTRMCSNMAQLVAQSSTGNLVQPTPAPLKIYFFWEHVLQWHLWSFCTRGNGKPRSSYQQLTGTHVNVCYLTVSFSATFNFNFTFWSHIFPLFYCILRL